MPLPQRCKKNAPDGDELLCCPLRQNFSSPKTVSKTCRSGLCVKLKPTSLWSHHNISNPPLRTFLSRCSRPCRQRVHNQRCRFPLQEKPSRYRRLAHKNNSVRTHRKDCCCRKTRSHTIRHFHHHNHPEPERTEQAYSR